MQSNNTTPPHQPTYGVHLDEETIFAILKYSVPELSAPPAISGLPHTKGFNNRIYIIEPKDGNSQSYVLKVNGRFFGAAKVENEVSCLLLLNHYCPDLPAPKVISWSTGGSSIARRDSTGKIINAEGKVSSDVPGWILMTHMPGSAVDVATLSSESKAELSKQIADSITLWRNNVPASFTSVNLHFGPYSLETAETSLYRPGSATGEQMHIYGVAESNNDCPPLTSLLDYYRTEIDFAVQTLSNDPAFVSNREALLPRLRRFIDETLPCLPIFQNRGDRGYFEFVHSDLFPRNIMMAGSPPRLTAIVDFEFSGFHPPMQEFVQEWLPEADGSDWPPDMHQMILEELGKRGQQTPRSLSSDEWEQTKKFALLRNYIAPWWIGTGSVEGDEMVRQLSNARKVVEEAIEELEKLVAKVE